MFWIYWEDIKCIIYHICVLEYKHTKYIFCVCFYLKIINCLSCLKFLLFSCLFLYVNDMLYLIKINNFISMSELYMCISAIITGFLFWRSTALFAC